MMLAQTSADILHYGMLGFTVGVVIGTGLYYAKAFTKEMARKVEVGCYQVGLGAFAVIAVGSVARLFG